MKKENILHKEFLSSFVAVRQMSLSFIVFLYILANWAVRLKRLSNIRIHYAQNINGITLSFIELCDRLQVS